MLLCFVKAFYELDTRRVCFLLKGGHDREGPLLVGGQALIRSQGQQLERRPGAAGGSIEGQHRWRQPISGPGRPGSSEGSAAGAQVVVDLAGDVTLQAADDLLLGQAFFGAPVDVGACRGV